MAVMNQSRVLLFPFLFFLLSLLPFSSCQSNHPQNIETFYPFPIQTPSPPPSPPDSNNLPDSTLLPSPPPLASSPEVLPRLQEDSSTHSGHTIAKAVTATAGSTLVVAGLLFFLIQRFVIVPRRRNRAVADSSGGRPAAFNNQFTQIDGSVGGLIVDENGLDVLYWRKLNGESKTNGFHKEVCNSPEQEKEENHKPEAVQEIPLLRGKSPTSHKKVVPEISIQDRIAADGQSVAPGIPTKAIEASNSTSQPPNPSVSPPPAPPPPPPPPPSPSVSMAVPKKQGPAPPLPPPSMQSNKIQAPPPLPVKGAGTPPPSKSAAVPKGIQGSSETGEPSTGKGINGQVKLKPLHWDKVNKNTDHSMVWDKVNAGSFRFDDDLMEALFGYVATNRRSTKRESSPKNVKPSSQAQIVILDSRKSQNIAIVLKSLAISREELLDALIDGQGLDPDCVEKLTGIAPTKEEQLRIIEFNGDWTRLAYAESFLYHLLKAIPSAFTRLNAMLFRSNYNTEIVHFKDNLQILELACKELRNQGLFVKLLEAVLKAGNRMNAGTSRGNAQAFKLTSLQKLADVKGTDQKTTLLHFIVQEIVRNEGKRCVINRNHSLSRISSHISNKVLENLDLKEEKEKEYMMLGLPIVGGLSAEFSNVKKAANIDYQGFVATCSGLADRTAEVKMLLPECAADGGGFGREMARFLEAAEEEFKAMKEEKLRIMELVRRTTEYYQAGSSKDREEHPLQLFVIVKDFLNMVDHVCVEIARNLQKRKTPTSSSGSSPKSPASSRMAVRFPKLPEHFMSSYSGSDTDF